MSRNKTKRIVLDDPVKVPATPVRFTVEILTESKKYGKYADILKAVFKPGQKVTYEEADKAIKDYLGRRI